MIKINAVFIAVICLFFLSALHQYVIVFFLFYSSVYACLREKPKAWYPFYFIFVLDFTFSFQLHDVSSLFF